MKRASIRSLCVALSLAAGGFGFGDQKIELPVTRVAIFSSGVGFFECENSVEGNASATLDFRIDQINDILKSLIVQDLGGGTISAVGYASQDPVAKTLKSFAVDITGKPTLAQLLDQLRGEPVEITGPKAIKGVIVGVEKQKLVTETGTIEYDVLNVLTDTGIVQLKVSELGGIRLTNEKIAAELKKALATLATSHDADKKSVVLNFDGTGQRKVRVAYLLEAPIWKTSYRLVLSEEGKPFLQGWATVENATEEDWRDVRLSLVSGRPISFRMDLYTPIYVPRPKEELELYASLRPPTYEGAITTELRQKAGMEEEDARGGRAPAGGARAMDAVGYAARAPAAPEIALQDAGVESVAAAAEAGELFEYAIQTPVSIPRQHSAMLPIVNQAIEGEKVSIYNPQTHAKYPLNGLRITNTSGLNLMQGPVTLFDGNIYAGDAKLPDLKPNEKRLIAYALDLATEVTVQTLGHPDEIVSLRIAKGTLVHKHRYVDERTYLVKNKDDKARTVLIEQAYGDEWKLVEPKEPFERTSQLSRFKLVVPAGETGSLKVVLEQVTDQTVVLLSLNRDQIMFYLRSRVISPEVKAALEKAVALRDELDQAARARQQLEQQHSEAVAEQARIRENLKTLTAESDVRQRQLKKFDDLETQIETLKGKLSEARQLEETKRRALEEYLLSLNVE